MRAAISAVALMHSPGHKNFVVIYKLACYKSLYFRISCLASLKRHQECLTLINERLEVESNNPDLFILRARLHLFSGDVSSNKSNCIHCANHALEQCVVMTFLLFFQSTLSYFDVKEALSLDPQNKEAGSMQQNLEENAELCKKKVCRSF